MLKQSLSQAFPNLLVMRYPDLAYLRNYLQTNKEYPTIILLPAELEEGVGYLEKEFPFCRTIQVGDKMVDEVTLNLQNKDEVLYLMGQLMSRIEDNISKANRIGKISHTSNDDDIKLLPLADSSQKVYILYN